MRKPAVTIFCLLFALLLLAGVYTPAALADAAPQSVTLSQDSVVLDLSGNTRLTLTASVQPADADQSILWQSADRAVATVSRGQITARRVGATSVTATARNTSVQAVCQVVVVDSSVPTSVHLSQAALTIDLAHGSQAQLAASALPAQASQKFKFTSSNTSVARVSSRGIVTGRKIGSSTIRVTSQKDANLYAECVVTVVDSRVPTSIVFEGLGSSLTLDRYQTLQLNPKATPAEADQGLRFKSSRSAVASVSSSGLITARRGGTAIITCYSRRSNTVFAQVEVTVKEYPSPTAIALTPAAAALPLGATLQLTPAFAPAGQEVCDLVTWKTSSAGRATVSQDGLVTARGLGQVTITCTSKQNSRVRATRKLFIVPVNSPYEVLISNEAGGQTLNETTQTMYASDEMQLAHKVLPEGKDASVRWTSSRSSVASVDTSGKVVAHRAGSVTITATSLVNKDVKASFKLNVARLPAPDSIALTGPASVLEFSDTMQLTAKALPEGENRSREFKWTSSSKSIATVSPTGLVTPRKLGTVTITCASAVNSRVRSSFMIKVVDSKLPDSLRLSHTGKVEIENGQRLPLSVEVLPSTAVQTVSWKSSKPSVATVDGNGMVTGVKGGSAKITVTSTYSKNRYATLQVKVVQKGAPTALALKAQAQTVLVGKTTLITPVPTPANASMLGVYSSSNPEIASVDQSGVVTAHKVGTAKITLVSSKNSSVAAILPIVVYDANTPGSVSLNQTNAYTAKGKTAQLTASVFPATAPQAVTWNSNNPKIATVDGNGRVTGVEAGSAVITATTTNGLSATCNVSVTSSYVSTVIPARTTAISGIAENLKKIDDIRVSAHNQIALLASQKTISENEATLRRQIIDRAFEMQAFPWMTESTQPYWTAKYAYKKYEPGKVYYGLPYIQNGVSGSSKNREYNVAKALNENRYTNSGKGYYLLNRKNLLDGMYVGGDCSSFVNIAQYGIGHPAAFLKTYTMDTSSHYRTISGYEKMMPGDFLVKHKSHTILFLYWVDAAKTRMMIIEQGGDGNTVICSIHDLSYYTSQGYILRRRSDFGK